MIIIVMLKRKMERNAVSPGFTVKQNQNSAAEELEQPPANAITSAISEKPFWKRFYDLECALNAELSGLQLPKSISHVYNPVEYAAELHCAYLQRFLSGPKKLLMVGLNPGPNGMVQTGIPFGNISTVRDLMKLSGEVEQPPHVHPKRPVCGLQCRTEEPSGARLWKLLQNLAGGSLDTFAQQCYVHNFCPLAFFDADGRNVTPSEFKSMFKNEISNLCLSTTNDLISLLRPDVVVAIGDYVFQCLRTTAHVGVRLVKLPHPSPRARGNQNWSEIAARMLTDFDVLKYIQNKNLHERELIS